MNNTLLSQPDTLFSSKPLFIDIEPTYGCNLRCRMCHVTYMKDTKPKFIDINRIDWSFVRDKDVSLGSVFEPTIHPTLNELIGRLNENNARISFITNALNLSPEKLSNLYNSKLNIVGFSFDGASKKKYEYIRQRSQYDRVVSNIKNFIEYHRNSDATFMINFTVCKYNMDEIIPAIDLWESIGAHTLNLIAMVSRDEDPFFAENSLFDLRSRFNEVLDTAADHVINNNLAISLMSPYFSKSEVRKKYDRHFLEPSEIVANKDIASRKVRSLYHHYGYGKSLIPHKTCRAPITTVRIDYDANVYICQSINIGNLYKNTFEEIWNSQQRNQTISQLIASSEQCDSCDYFKYGINFQNIDYEQADNFVSHNLLADKPNFEPQLITEGYRGFNVLKVKNQYYAIPQGEGSFSLDRVEKQAYSASYKADNESSLRHQILSRQPHLTIQLIEESYKGFNILAFGGQFYALPQGEGSFSLDRIESQDYSLFYQAEDEATLRHQIEDIESTLQFDPATPVALSQPLLIDLEPSYGCNLRCRMCHVTYMKNQTLKHLDVDRIDWSFVRDREVSLGSLFEPTINPSFNKLIGRLNEENARISITTNAFNLSRKHLGNLYKSKLNLVYFSFDGASKEKYEYIRQRSQYERVVANIKDFIEQQQNSGATFIVNFTVCKYNMDEIIPAIDLWESLGVHTLGLIAMVSREKYLFFSDNSLVDEIELYEKTVEAAADHIIKNNYQIALSAPYFTKSEVMEKYASYSVGSGLIVADKNKARKRLPRTYSLHHYYGYGESIIPHQICRSPLTTARIDYDANVYICQTIQVGNLYDNTFTEIWNSLERSQAISQLIENSEQCNTCDYFRFCLNSKGIDYQEADNFSSQTLLSRPIQEQNPIVEEGFKGFNLLEIENRFYAIPQKEGIFSIERIEKQDYSAFYIADDISNLRRQIVKALSFPFEPSVQLIDQGHKGFNILEVEDKFYAIPQGEGKFSIERIEKQDYSAFFIGDDELDVRHHITLYREQMTNRLQKSLKYRLKRIFKHFLSILRQKY